MPIPRKYHGKFFYHFSHFDNLHSIIENGLLSTNRKRELGIEHHNVAALSIQQRRSEMNVPCGPHGTVHDYVPFYFALTNPMFLSLVNSKNHDQNYFVFLGISIDRLTENDAVFTDASANTVIPPNFFESPEDLERLNWELIDSRKWSAGTDDQRHQKMAEVLIKDQVPIDQIDKIIVWNQRFKDGIEEIFTEFGIPPPSLEFQDSYHRCFYTKFQFGTERENESLVTGPRMLKREFENTVSEITENRQANSSNHSYPHQNVQMIVEEIDRNFTAISELEGIFALETANPMHSENVSDHTKSVVQNLIDSDAYNSFDETDKLLLKLSAYLHDIGKGPKSKWKNGIQKTYPDHPVDSLKMLTRILSQDILQLSEYEVRKICMLVAYHDLIGDILNCGRDVEQLYEIINEPKDFELLSALNHADIKAINSTWTDTFNFRITNFKESVFRHKEWV